MQRQLRQELESDKAIVHILRFVDHAHLADHTGANLISRKYLRQ
jgi:hypothetical protein